MGLDMYLKKAKRIGDITPEQLENIQEYFHYLDRPDEYKNDTMEEWCGISIEKVNMSLADSYRGEYIHRYASWDKEKKHGWKTIIETIADWRKANQIHNWFVENIQDGVDECDMYEVTKEQLEELLSICKKVIANSKLSEGKIVNGQILQNGKWVNNYIDGKYIEDPSVAKELLPTTRGCFFGSTHYDQWYYQDVEDTINIIENVLKETDFEKEIVMYVSSW